jgi:hypothetical protein
VPGQVEAERRLFVGEPLGLGPIARRDQRERRALLLFAEQRHLRGGRFRLVRLGQRDADRSEERRAARVDRVERAAADQRFDRAAIDDALVDAPAEIAQVAERAAGGAGGDDRLDRLGARALDSAEAVADALRVDRLEAVVRCVDVGWDDREAVGNRVVAQRPNLVGVVHHQREVRRHERRGMMRLEVGGLVGDERISCRMRLVEAVAGELLHEVEERGRLRAADAVALCARDEDVAVLRHLFLVLLAHRAAQEIRLAERVAADHLRDLHHLFLVHHHAVGRPEDRLEPRVGVVEALAPRLARRCKRG